MEGCWGPPPRGVLKINTDGCSRQNLDPIGIGGVARDSFGTVQFIFSVYKGMHINNFMEALAILYVVEHCCELGWRSIICESNSQVVLTLLNKQRLEDVGWQLVLIINQILQLCASLEFVSFCHILREWNGVMDCLAKRAYVHM
ncbi:uncharacterized protein LOC131860096 [Cryptomeria japonica]|uniref:uncharacterized protein LOC131860096 n=1 Tax=Cryptomeria japonica TaxID=3369 RepID=UPI0027DA9CBB|nr:uncharacterized protein LOC131860096 [Cryptomeria japonica]